MIDPDRPLDPDEGRRLQAAWHMVRETVEGVHLTGLLHRFPITLTMDPGRTTTRSAYIRVTLSWRTVDRKDPTKESRTHVDCGVGVDAALAEGPAFVRRMIYDQVKFLVLHELDECWTVDGVRENEPHPDQPYDKHLAPGTRGHRLFRDERLRHEQAAMWDGTAWKDNPDDDYFDPRTSPAFR